MWHRRRRSWWPESTNELSHEPGAVHLDRGHLSLLLNLSHVPYMDSASVGELASSGITVRNRRGKLKIAASLSPVTELLAISKLDTVVEVFDTEAEALQSFDR